MWSSAVISILIQMAAAGMITAVLLLGTYVLLKRYWSSRRRASRALLIALVAVGLALAPIAVDYMVVALRAAMGAAIGVYVDTGIIALLLPSLIAGCAAFVINRRRGARTHSVSSASGER